MKKIIGWAIFIGVIVYLYGFMFNESGDNNNLDLGVDRDYSYGDGDYSDTEEIDELFNKGGWSKYAQLDSVEKAAYEKLYAAARKGELECTVTVDAATRKESVEKILLAVCDDNPELFWLNCGGTYSYPRNRMGLIEVDLKLGVYDYLYYKTDMQKYVDKLNRKVDLIVASANELETDYEKALFVHDYLVRNSYYAHDALAETKKTNHDAKYEIIRSAYSCIVEGETVCAGYAKAFKLVLDRLGINNIYVTGDAGGPHAWSCAELDGEAYLFDLTWDDPIEGPSLYIGHSYFGLTDMQISFTHKADEELFRYPSCNDTRYNYFDYNGLRFDSYDLDAIEKYVNANMNEGVTIAFSNAKAYNDAVNGLIGNREWAKISALGKKISYSVSKGALTISFF